MKRIIMIVAIPLLVVLISSFGAESQTHKGLATTELEPVVSRAGTLINLKDGKGRLLYINRIDEGYKVSFHFGKDKEQTFDAIGDRISNPNVSYHQEGNYVAGLTTQDGLKVTSGFGVDPRNGKIWAVRMF